MNNASVQHYLNFAHVNLFIYNPNSGNVGTFCFVLERQSLSEVKMGRGPPICERVCQKIVEYFKNNVPQCQIAKALQISSSTVHKVGSRGLMVRESDL